MADFYALEQVGGPDGTQAPPKKLDGRMVGAKDRVIRATKPTGQALASGDRLYLGKLPIGSMVRGFSVNSDTSFGTSTLSIGTTATPALYVNGKTMTATDTPTSVGPKASAAIAAPLSADQDIWLTVGTATIAGATVAAFYITYTTAN
jgi:hypothetical protein